MRFIAAISIVAIITVGVLIGLFIQRLKSRQAEQLVHESRRLNLAQNQLVIANRALRTIRDLQGDSAFDAQMALDEIDKLRDEFYNQEALQK